ncbi:hypothetical protein IT087_03075 [Candidatus Uhrbacteria bacterium]|nr:hypothetical protein [Candidatus Uhrbacteria bacterium]
MGITDQVSQGLGFLFGPLNTPEAVRAVGAKLQQRRDPILLGRLKGALHHGHTPETRLAAIEELSRNPEDQPALHHAAFHDPDLTIRVAAAQRLTGDDLEPLTAMSDDPEVRVAFTRTTRLLGVLIAMKLCDPDETVKAAADEAIQSHKNVLISQRDDPRVRDYYGKFNP